jgi:hypothetical protein
MFRVIIAVGLLSAAATNVFAELPISVGVKGGVALTDAFQSTAFLYGDFFPEGEVYIHYYSPSKDYLVGPFVELRLPFGLGVEADALYRPLHLSSGAESRPQSGNNLTRSDFRPANENTHAWEFPILTKYRFKLPIARPYLDAGPSFRTSGAFSYLSNHGVSAGAGVDIKAFVLHISPEVRYTRWAANATGTRIGFLPSSNLNQVELLVGISF